MNDNTQMTSTPGSSLIPDSTSVITTMHLTLIAIFAVVVILGILWGMRLKRQRKAAEREVAADNNTLSHPAPAQEDATAPATVRVAPPPTTVSPAPPPIADIPAVGTPADPTPIDRTQDEPIAASAPLDANPAAQAASPAPAADEAPATAATEDDAIPVTTLKGLGPKVAARLAELGVTDARQLAALDDAGAARLDAELGSFSGRMARDRWIEQARLLAAGDRAGYEATFGKL